MAYYNFGMVVIEGWQIVEPDAFQTSDVYFPNSEVHWAKWLER